MSERVGHPVFSLFLAIEKHYQLWILVGGLGPLCRARGSSSLRRQEPGGGRASHLSLSPGPETARLLIWQTEGHRETLELVQVFLFLMNRHSR